MDDLVHRTALTLHARQGCRRLRVLTAALHHDETGPTANPRRDPQHPVGRLSTPGAEVLAVKALLARDDPSTRQRR